MMDSTLNRGYPYPECDPPLIKDASDIAHLRDLAVAVDTDVQAVYDRTADVIARPDAARMAMFATLASTENTVFPFFNSRNWDSTGTSMTPTAEGILRLVEPGWYQVGTWTQLVSATFLGARVRFLQNGVPATSWCPQAEITQTNMQMPALTATVYVPIGGDALSLELRIGATTPSFTYASRIWAVQTVRG